jgi:hypothetical protein
MEYGRIIRVTLPSGESSIYVVAQQDSAEAVSLLAPHVEPGAELEPVGRASLRLLEAMSISLGEFKRTDS